MLLSHLSRKYSTQDADLLLAHVLGVSREYIHTHPEHPLSHWQRLRAQLLLKKRAAGVPLAYLTGHKEFFSRDFLVNKHTLIPRPETELLVELAQDACTPDTTLIDVGTGSGCIAITLAMQVPLVHVLATDMSHQALRVAKKNAHRHGVNVRFFRGNLLAPVLEYVPHEPVVITANLPYLDESDMREPSIQAEPRLALFGGPDGLDLYRELLDQLCEAHLLTPIVLLCEINPGQAEALIKEVTKRFSHAEIKTHTDLSGRDRVVRVSISA